MDSRWRNLSLAWAFVLGCGPQVDLGTTGATEGGTSSDPPAGTSTGPQMPPVDETDGGEVTTDPTAPGTTGVADTTTTTDTGTDDTTGGPASVCDPQPQPISAFVSLEDAGPDDVSIDAPCVVETIDVRSIELVSWTLRCQEGRETLRTIEVYADPPADPGLQVGEAVHLRLEYRSGIDAPGWEHAAIRDEQGELVAAMYGSLATPDGFAPDLWYQPWSFTFTLDVCPPEPYEPPAGDFIVDPCPDQIERGAFVVGSPSGESLVYDATSAEIDGYAVLVPYARRHVPQENGCGGPYEVGRIVLLRNTGG